VTARAAYIAPVDAAETGQAMPRCPTKRFRTARYARRVAWSLESNPSKRQVPTQCPTCTAWHLTAQTETDQER
jgi:hypothetical protein